MTAKQQRDMALGAARSQLRHGGDDPKSCAFERAWAALDEVYRSEPSTVAGQWYVRSSDAQVAAFRREWEQWRKGR
jgi:hypothetical protein